MSAEEAAAYIRNGDVLATSGFTPAGYPKAIPAAIAARAAEFHLRGEPFRITLCTGASVGDELDGVLARADAVSKRIPYQSNADMRERINSGEIEFVDFHLSHVAQYFRYGFVDRPSYALIEALDVTNDGKIYLTMSGGMSATYARMAKGIFIELNRHYRHTLKGIHDVYVPESPPNRAPIPIFNPADRIGTPYVQVPPEKIIGIVETDKPDSNSGFREPDQTSKAMAQHIVDFLRQEEAKGRLPRHLPYQSGVGNIANAVLGVIASTPGIEPITMYTEVLQDSIFQLVDAEKLKVASTCSLTFSPEKQQRFQDEIALLKERFVLRQQEMSNHPEIIRRLGVISMNTAIEIDIFGNVNSTHVMGSRMQNGIGGSGDFCRNAYISIYMAPSTAKAGDISTIVPMVTHVDHNEHSVQVVVTEQGLADLRGLSPVRRAQSIINNCAHPDYRRLLLDYLEYGLERAPSKHTPHVLDRAFDFHRRFAASGTMKG